MVNDHLLRHGEVMVKDDAVKAHHSANQLALQAAVENLQLGNEEKNSLFPSSLARCLSLARTLD